MNALGLVATCPTPLPPPPLPLVSSGQGHHGCLWGHGDTVGHQRGLGDQGGILTITRHTALHTWASGRGAIDAST